MSSLSDLPPIPLTLAERVNKKNDFSINESDGRSFILYLPTVVLRKKHNPAFALSCHLANAYNVPLVVLAVVLDDKHLPNPLLSETSTRKPVVFTARRIAFVLEALQEASRAWEQHGAGVAIRVHGPQCRTPHHLTLARKAMAVITDEPFVEPYRSFVDTIEKAVYFAKVPLFCVDGSTTVPPVHKLLKKTRDASGRIVYQDSPAKAWQWEKRTSANRKGQVMGAVKDGHLDAPELARTLKPNFFLNKNTGEIKSVVDILPVYWKVEETPSPGKRPWTVSELNAINNPKEWIMQWPGIDTTVPPCQQTHGSYTSAMKRWNHFRANHIEHYAKKRNDVTQPHAVSRMSCYLNYGVVSIFQIVSEVWDSKKGKLYKGVCKFEDELIKWREIGYVHSFATPDYNLPPVVPDWASRWLASEKNNNGRSHSVEVLERGNTDDETWNAMQRYLVETGELHNNARMSWGKTMVHWQKHDYTLAELLHQMVYINDRYALDGLSPPSYAGLLWCLGWCDKPKDGQGGISEKPTSRYRKDPSDFERAKHALLSGNNGSMQALIDANLSTQTPKKQRTLESYSNLSSNKRSKTTTPIKGQTSVDSFFKVSG